MMANAADRPAGPDHKSRWHIQVRDLHKAFGEHHVLKGVNLDVERGEINFVIGGSGGGKSVLMKHLMGLLQPDHGSILVEGQEIVGLNDLQMRDVRRHFGMLFQNVALFDSMTVMENVAFPLLERYPDMAKSEMIDRIRELLNRLDLGHVTGIEEKFPAELSGGMKKRVGLARALIDRPQILLYDEPTTGLDPIATKNVDDMIRKTADDFGVTSVVISHDMASTFRIGDRIAMLYGGKIIVSGTPQELLRAPHPALREFVETSGAVSFPTDSRGERRP
jgi:phospholipid/cholesterol/gamma-HCH transport system ATP-binding protein